MANVEDYNAECARIVDSVGDDWNTRRARLYIVAKILERNKALARLEAELRFEKAVSERVSQTFLQTFRYLREEDKT